METIEALEYYRTLAGAHDVEAESARLLADPSFLDGSCFPRLHRRDARGTLLPYRDAGCSRDASRLAELEAQTDRPRRREEFIAMQLYARGYVEGIGHVLDYQTPIGGNAERLADDPALQAALAGRGYRPGKVDLVAYDERRARLVLLELKVPDSPESLLRCAAEAWTYLNVIDQEALVEDMRAVAAARGVGMAEQVEVSAAPLVFWGSLQHRQLRDPERYPQLHRLMGALGMEVVVISSEPGQGVLIEDLRAWSGVEAELCSALRAAYRELRPGAVFADESALEGLPPNPYYLEDVEMNLACEMAPEHVGQYGAGLGGELQGKMRALRSSSAMTFNLLGNHSCRVLGGNALGLAPGSYSVEYEAQLPTLKASVSNRRANLDALLVGEGGAEVVACEMKMMEWLQLPARDRETGRCLKAAYLKAESYDCADPEDAAVLAATASSICDAFADRRYDAAQMFRHAAALLGAAEHGALPGARRVVLLNCIWEPSDPGAYSCAGALRRMAAEEHEGFERFHQLMGPVAALFTKHGVKLNVARCTPTELAACLEKTSEERAYLQRYA